MSNQLRTPRGSRASGNWEGPALGAEVTQLTPFVDRLGTGTFQAEADINEDGVVNLLDVDPFILLLSG